MERDGAVGEWGALFSFRGFRTVSFVLWKPGPSVDLVVGASEVNG